MPLDIAFRDYPEAQLTFDIPPNPKLFTSPTETRRRARSSKNGKTKESF